MNASKVRGLIAGGIIIVPVLVWLFLTLSTHQQYHSLPLVYRPTNGDSALCRVSDFLLQTPDGKPFSATDMAGSVWVVGFFNRADTLRHSIALHYLSDAYTNADRIKTVRFLWVAQVASADSAAVWQQMATQLSAGQAGKWVIATGSRETVQQLAASMGLPEYRDSLSGKPINYPPVALVDKQGRVRGGNNYMSKKGQIPSGYYFSTKDFDMQKIKEDMRALMMIEYPEDLKR